MLVKPCHVKEPQGGVSVCVCLPFAPSLGKCGEEKVGADRWENKPSPWKFITNLKVLEIKDSNALTFFHLLNFGGHRVRRWARAFLKLLHARGVPEDCGHFPACLPRGSRPRCPGRKAMAIYSTYFASILIGLLEQKAWPSYAGPPTARQMAMLLLEWPLEVGVGKTLRFCPKSEIRSGLRSGSSSPLPERIQSAINVRSKKFLRPPLKHAKL